MSHGVIFRAAAERVMVQPPRRQGLSVLDDVVADEVFQFSDAHLAHRKVVLFSVGLASGLRSDPVARNA